MAKFFLFLFIILLILIIFGCKGKAKVTPIQEYTCLDNDGGLDYYTYGKIILHTELKEDNCLDEQNLIEFYCEENQIKSMHFKCECSNGLCKK